MITETDLPQALFVRLQKKTKAELINIMYEALALMQQYNGRSKMYCVCVAMGGNPVETDNGYRYEFSD